MFQGREWERIVTALMAMPRSQWDAICADCFPDVPAYTVTTGRVIAKINNYGVQHTKPGSTTYYIDAFHTVIVYSSGEGQKEGASN